MIVNTELAKSIGCDQKDKWETPAHIFIKLDKEFHFTLDPCCENHTAKCTKYFTEEDNGLLRSWGVNSVFVNPPYSRGNVDLWVKKCYQEHISCFMTVVTLLPVSTSASWFHDYIVGKAQIRFINKRIRFVGAPYTAPFSSMVVVFGQSGIQTFDQ